METKTHDTSPSPKQQQQLILYSFWQSSCSWRVRFALNLKGIPYEYKPVNLDKGDQFTPEFEQVNPLHFVPVLVDGDVTVSDSYAILLYLEDKYPEHALLPVDTKRKYLNLQVASIVGSSIQPLHMMGKEIELKAGSEERQRWTQHNLKKGFSALEKLLKDSSGRFATGDEICMADVFLAPQIAVAVARFNVDMSEFPTLSKVYEAYKVLPAFQSSSPQRQPDAIV
ncbi:maleylacetoacetate isomerase [Ranunculus cassubicifolius]